MKKSFLVLSFVALTLSGCNSNTPENNPNQTPDVVTDHMAESQARQIAEKSCIKGGEALGEGFFNENTGTWWFNANLNATQPGCSPACVVSEKTQTAELNWRCTGAIPDEDVTSQKDDTPKKETTLKKVSQDERYIRYEGAITLSGTYREYHPNTMMGGLLCFEADEATGYLIPRTENDTRDPWFCFNFDDQEAVKAQFGIKDQEIFTDDNTDACIEGKATIEVSNYVADLLEGETVDKATLEKIVTKEPYAPCQ